MKTLVVFVIYFLIVINSYTVSYGKNSKIFSQTSLDDGQQSRYRQMFITVEDILKESQIIPNVIDKTSANTSSVNVRYAYNSNVFFGNEFTPTQVSNQPQVHWLPEYNSLYTLCMTDPDVPSRQMPFLAEFNHWLVVNIPANSVNLGNTFAEYTGSAPPFGTGLHRYVFLIYKQSNVIPVIQLPINRTNMADRFNFSIRRFAQQFGLGDPIAANFFLSQWNGF